MPVLLYRVDERLIHGQVVVGWGAQLRPDRYVIVDPGLVASEWEQDLYRLGAGDASVEFVDVEGAREALPAWESDPRGSIVLTRDIATMYELARGGTMEGAEVNLGGMHHGPDRMQVLTYLHLTPEDQLQLQKLSEEEGVTISARDLPGAHRVGLKALVG